MDGEGGFYFSFFIWNFVCKRKLFTEINKISQAAFFVRVGGDEKQGYFLKGLILKAPLLLSKSD